ncbi:MAG: oligosaccharide flippase family protein [Acetobacteraceae bacterium]|nr:oligosaccharide flippase family protein [Acetobacteraceae bacterium]
MKHAVFWSGLEASVNGVLSFIGAFIVARLIGPAELGVGASVVSVHVLLWIAANSLFADAIVQQSSPGPTTQHSAFWGSAAAGCVFALLQAAAGWPLAAILADHRLTLMSGVLALPLPLVGAAGAVQGLLVRERRYRALAIRTMAGQSMSMVVGVAAAFSGAGAWALVFQQCAGATAGAAVLMASMGRLPAPCGNWRDIARLLRVGLPLTGSTLLQHARYRLFAVLIGGVAGTAALGQIHMSFRLVDSIRELAFTALWRLMLPILSQRQTDREALRQQVDRLLAFSSLCMLPLAVAMAASVGPLVGWLLGPDWAASTDGCFPLIGLMVVLVLTFPSGVALVAQGRAAYTLFGNCGATAATLAGVLLLRPSQPLHAMLVWVGAQLCVMPYALWVNGRALGWSPLRPLRAGAPALILSSLALLAAIVVPDLAGLPRSPPELLATRLLTGVVVCGAGMMAAWGCRYFPIARSRCPPMTTAVIAAARSARAAPWRSLRSTNLARNAAIPPPARS